MNTELFETPFGIAGYVVLLGVLCAISVIDWRTRRIPNELVGVVVILRLVLLVVGAPLAPGITGLAALISNIVNALCFTVLLVVVKVIADRTTGKESLGWGDVKLFAAGALFLTATQTFMALCIACLGALALAVYFKRFRNDATFPFGPALALGIALALTV